MPSPTQHRVTLLAQLALFRELSRADIDKLAAQVHLVHAQRKDVLYTKGDPCEGFYVVVYGRVKLSLVSARGHDKPLELIEPGGCFGEVTMFLERPHTLTAMALDDALLVYVPRSALLQMIEQDSRYALRLLASLSMRARHVVEDIEAFSLQPPAARVVTYLLRLLPPNAATCAKIELAIQKNLVAAQLNLAPETLSRYFRELSELGLISLEGRTIVVHDVDRLGEYMASLH